MDGLLGTDERLSILEGCRQDTMLPDCQTMEIDPKALIAVLIGEATEEERVLVERWRAASPGNDLEYQRRERMWEVLGSLGDAPGADPGASGGRGAQAVGSPPSTFAPSWSRSARRLRKIAVTGLIAATILAVIVIQRAPGRAGYEPLAAADVVTGPDEVRTVHLRDGTVVRLGRGSRLGVTDVSGPRDVFVDGQAYFVVPGGQPTPFRVHSRNGQVTVVGTRFEVAARGSDIQVLVVEGEVEFAANNGTVSLRKGQSGTAVELAVPVVDSVADVYGRTAWIGEFAAYDQTPLSEIAAEFRRRFEFEIEIADSVLATRTVSGMMRDQSVEDMVSNVCIAVDARCTFSTGRVRMEIGPGMPASAP